MKNIVTAGIVLGLSCAVWTFVMGLTGWYKHPVLLMLFFLVIPIEIGVLIWGLRRTAAEGRRYGGQVLAGTLISVVGGVIIMGSSLLFTQVAFPNYFQDLHAMQEQLLREAGQSEEQIRAALEVARRSASPINNAIQGFIGTVVTGCLASLVIAGFVRAK